MPADSAGHLPNSPFNARRQAAAVPPEQFEVGDRVTHDRYGLGRVTWRDPDVAVVVVFGGQSHRITLPARELRHL